MGYYTIRLTPQAQKLCTIVFPWGKYSYLRLPMGVSNSPDIFQSKISQLMVGLDFVRAYLDDVLVATKDSFTDHLKHLEQVLERLDKANLRINIEKCAFATQEFEYLGYLVTTTGIRPLPSKVEAILQLKAPKTLNQLRSFLGMVNYYRDMWKRRSHLLTPLTEVTKVPRSSKSFNWKEAQDSTTFVTTATTITSTSTSTSTITSTATNSTSTSTSTTTSTANNTTSTSTSTITSTATNTTSASTSTTTSSATSTTTTTTTTTVIVILLQLLQ
jgi:CCR4-NOT transcriptional regulation complex NOT5 subunit